jgi:hypothetical protein
MAYPSKKKVPHPVYNSLRIDRTSIDQQNHIRLLTILPGCFEDEVHCSLDVVKLNPGLQYEALSYTWGTTTELDAIIVRIQRKQGQHALQNTEHHMHIRTNLYHALKGLRYSDRARVLWIDALCINQADDEERSHQVGIMRDIYKTASRVVVWLGQGSKKIMSAFNHLSTISASERTIISNAHESACRDICHNTYWTRIWIIQELVMATDIVLMYGTAKMEWRNFIYAMRHVYNSGYETGNVFRLINLREELSVTTMVDNAWLHEKTTFGHRNDRLDRLLYMFGNNKSTDFRDRVYALLGLANRGFHIDIDYTIDRETLAGRVVRLCQEYDGYSDLGAFENQRLKPHEIWRLLMQDSDRERVLMLAQIWAPSAYPA